MFNVHTSGKDLYALKTTFLEEVKNEKDIVARESSDCSVDKQDYSLYWSNTDFYIKGELNEI